MSKFTDRLYARTKEAHKCIDTSEFVNVIKTKRLAQEMYMMFNIICIERIQSGKILFMDDDIYDGFERDLSKYTDKNGDVVYFLPESDKMDELLVAISQYPLEHSYLFYLGLAMGGNILKKYIPNTYHDLLIFDNANENISKFKNFLDNYTAPENEDKFIERVNSSYKLIGEIFDLFNSKLV